MNAEEEYDTIVVGIGISDSRASKELCEKGLKTLVLERGRAVKRFEACSSRRVSLPEPYRTTLNKNRCSSKWLKRNFAFVYFA